MPRRMVEERIGWLTEQIASRSREECWPWPYYVHPSGHAKVGRGRLSASGNPVTEPAYRVAWELAHRKPFPAGRYACHTCSNPACVNPDHVYVGTHRSNMADAGERGEMARGSHHGRAKITEATASEIDKRLRAGASQRAIAADVGVNRSTVKHIAEGRSWAWLTGRPTRNALTSAE